MPGPVLGVKLASGKWTLASRIKPEQRLVGYVTEVLSEGPMFIRVRVTYHYAEKGNQVIEITLRAGEPLVRLDERYAKAGSVSYDLGTNLQPARYEMRLDYNCTFQNVAIPYDSTTSFAHLVGWAFNNPPCSPELGLFGGPGNDYIGLLSTDSDWLPFPYDQSLQITPGPGKQLTASGTMTAGQRHWGIYVGTNADFPDPARDLCRWWNKHVAFPLDKISHWQLTWDSMEQIEFPHTFFSKEDLPAIRARLHADPDITAYMKAFENNLNRDWYWYVAKQNAENSKSPEVIAQFQKYKTNYYPRGITKSMNELIAAAFYTGSLLPA